MRRFDLIGTGTAALPPSIGMTMCVIETPISGVDQFAAFDDGAGNFGSLRRLQAMTSRFSMQDRAHGARLWHDRHRRE